MKKTLLALAMLFTFSFGANAQQQAVTANNANVEVHSKNVTALTSNFNVSKADLTKAVESYFSDALKKVKAGKDKPYVKYSGVNWTAIPLQSSDVYYKVDGDKKTSSITIFVSKGYDNFVNPTDDPEIYAGMGNFLTTDLVKAVDKITLQQQIDDQTALIAGLEKDSKKMASSQDKTQKQIEKLQKELDSNKADLDAKNQEIEKQKGILEGLKSRL